MTVNKMGGAIADPLIIVFPVGGDVEKKKGSQKKKKVDQHCNRAMRMDAV